MEKPEETIETNLMKDDIGPQKTRDLHNFQGGERRVDLDWVRGECDDRYIRPRLARDDPKIKLQRRLL